MSAIGRGLAALILLVMAGRVDAAAPKEPAVSPAELRVAVLPFDAASEGADGAQYASLGSGIQAMLTTDLASAPQLKLVERDKLAAVQSELALAKTAAIDRTTAVKAGKLLGASHLLVGSIAIVGKAMRIDARLVDATSGEVVLADKIEGDKELFFELEKALAGKLLAALGESLTPKEKARLAKIHTADFDAFRRFSDGIVAFDHKAFDDARKALREALEKDAEFQLARLTLDDYEVIIKKLEARTDLLEAGERQAKDQARTARAVEQKQILERLFSLSQSKAPMERMPALYALTRWYDVMDDRKLEVHLTGDAFQVARTCDALVQAYVADAEKLFGKVPLFGTRDFIGRPPSSAEEVAEKQEHWLARYFGTNNKEAMLFKNRLLDDVERAISYRDFARQLHLDVVGEARLWERAYKLALTLDPDAVGAYYQRHGSWRASVMSTLGERFREAGLFDASTRWFAESGRVTNEPFRARDAAEEVEKNRNIEAYLATHPSPLMREWLMLTRYRVPDALHEKEWAAAIETRPLSPKGRSVLANARAMRPNRDQPYVLIGGRPLYPMESSWFGTGKRTDPLAATDLDYYRNASRSAGEDWWKAFFDGSHKGAMSATFKLQYAVSDEWWNPELSSNKPDLASSGFVAERPEVVFLFGAQDIDVPLVEDDDKAGGRRLQRGLRAYGVRIAEDRVELVKVSEPEVRTGFSVARNRLSFEVLDVDEGAVKDGAKVVISVRGREVSAQVGDLSVDEKLDDVPTGFTGFGFLRPGHLAIVGPVVTIGR